MLEPLTLFAFDRADEAEWNVVNDGVMGGRSAGFVTVEDGTLRFTGTLVTRGGGFTLVRARPRPSGRWSACRSRRSAAPSSVGQ